MKVKIGHSLRFHVMAQDSISFSESFLLRMSAFINTFGVEKFVNTEVHSATPKEFVFSLVNVDLSKAAVLKQEIITRLVLLSEHGPEGEILDKLLAGKPHLRNHPRTTSIVSAFTNLLRVIDEVEQDTKASTLHEVQKLADDPLANLAALSSVAADAAAMDKERRREYREQCIRGQSDAQKRSLHSAPKPSKIPDVYKQMEKREADEEAAGDFGNIFTAKSDPERNKA